MTAYLDTPALTSATQAHWMFDGNVAFAMNQGAAFARRDRR